MNPSLVIHDRLWTLLEASAAVLALFKVGNRANLSTPAGRLRDLSRAAPADFPSLTIDLDSGATNQAGYSTFGMKGGASVVDYGVERTDLFKIVLKTDSQLLSGVLAAEHTIEAALLLGGRSLGIAWVSNAAFRWSRVRQNVNNTVRWVSTAQLTVTSRPRLSALTAS